MRKLILCVLALLACYGQGTAQTVTVADVEALPGETVTFVLNLNGGKADTYASLQFNVLFPSTGFTTTGDYTISSAWKGASATVGDVDETGLAIVPVSSAETIAGSDVESLLTVDFKVGDDVTLGDYDVTLSKITFGYGFTDKDIAPDVTFQVHVVAAHTVVLDENSTTAPEAADGVNVHVLRTIKANEWCTICLPFAMTAEQCQAAFGSDVQLADFTGTETEFDDADNVVGIKANFSSVSAIEANHPYIIKVSEAVTEFTVDGVDIVANEDEAYVEFDNGKSGSRRVVYSGFYGTYHAGTALDEYTLFLSGGKFWYSMGLTQMKAYRAYFAFLDVLTEVESAAARVSMVFDGETGVGAALVNSEGVNSEYYNLSGQRVEQPAVKGVYIKNHKKIIVK